MKPDEWWQNFALGVEVDISGTFIYNGIQRLDKLENLGAATDIFEVLYNLSVGIERLLKVAIILIEYSDELDIEAFERSLISHNVMDLANRVDTVRSLSLSGVHKEFLSLLSKFYKTHRYGRFSLGSVPDIRAEKDDFLNYLEKHLKIETQNHNEFFPVYNTDQIRKFVGKIVFKIAKSVFTVIGRQATELNIYTDELRGDSKAIRVFYGEKLDFIEERIKKKELLLFLMHPDSTGSHIDLLRSFQALDLDPEMAPNYISALINDTHLYEVEEEIDELYTELDDISRRISFVEIMDNEYLSYDDEEDEEP
ncbi:hypothetical protein ThidrDRAFT_3379 [Thiorhodococcus drewsii AZ1]|uniref:Uncharacterized protein n=1 Tax=Thiorhodococcus drewsii AZ1 TaxID=765913 RepID=G2E516_9GAMM|nr:hypothetical protein [Thiorhodococcus drewsii]EGV29063.1 hypothetical protein ThidrDRAFT_3379 [Thiorhodococcus drewsii AZ1]